MNGSMIITEDELKNLLVENLTNILLNHTVGDFKDNIDYLHYTGKYHSRLEKRYIRNQLIAYLLKDYWGKIKFDNLSKNNREIIKSKMYKLYKFYKEK